VKPPENPAADPGYWIARWSEGRTGFHRASVQPWLVEHVAKLAPKGDERVLVPLCGKSVDLAWLESRGHRVLGVDVAEQALREFLVAQRRTATERASAPFTVFATGSLELWCGDFFALDPARHGTFPAIFDRAALIAFPEDRRAEYARKIVSLLAPGGRLLLVAMEYDQQKWAGPPFSVTRAEIARRYGDACTLEPLAEKSLLDEEPVWRERGVDRLVETLTLLRRR
jgi:thiopurine S-methyltransferase